MPSAQAQPSPQVTADPGRGRSTASPAPGARTGTSGGQSRTGGPAGFTASPRDERGAAARVPVGVPEWWEDALCLQVGDADLWFPEKGASALPAKRVCAGCPVRAECLEHALTAGERFGIWGGLSERQRRRLTEQGAA